MYFADSGRLSLSSRTPVRVRTPPPGGNEDERPGVSIFPPNPNSALRRPIRRRLSSSRWSAVRRFFSENHAPPFVEKSRLMMENRGTSTANLFCRGNAEADGYRIQTPLRSRQIYPHVSTSTSTKWSNSFRHWGHQTSVSRRLFAMNLMCPRCARMYRASDSCAFAFEL